MCALVLIAVTGGGVYFCYLLAKPFIPALAAALSLAVLFAPLHRWMESKVKFSNLAASLSVSAVAIIAIVPATFAADRIIVEATQDCTIARPPKNGDSQVNCGGMTGTPARST